MALYNPANTLDVTKAAVAQLIGKGLKQTALDCNLLSQTLHCRQILHLNYIDFANHFP